MKKYISILLAVVLSASLLAGCGGGSGNSEQKPATEAKEDAAQPEENEAAEPAADAAQSQDAAQAQDASAQDTDANTNPAAGFYQIYVIDAATLDPIEGACTYSKPPRVIRTARRSSRSRRIHAKRHTSWKKSKPEQKLQRIPQTVKTVMTRSFRLNGTVRIQVCNLNPPMDRVLLTKNTIA